ncbi:hypothetical protein VN97_g12255 [Penicillium thymicola]|uniref:Uncharacterized protein n=1 Tax=Penicillium thymicola TaxID=293382 RepID=A0AAI9T5T9_PENTH|nr:hypothetical protein VN97_g12255 [Penicillium thymicola]
MIPIAIILFFTLAQAVQVTSLAGTANSTRLVPKQMATRLVFAHFMVGATSTRRSVSDYDEDMRRAKSLGIDAFALNIGVDSYTDQQLELAYESAARNLMKVFISFDFNWWQTDQAADIGYKIVQFATRPAQLTVDNKVFASTFGGDGLNEAALRAAAGMPIFFAPNFHPGFGADISTVDGLFNWLAWPHDGRNKAPTRYSNISLGDGDQAYLNVLAGRAYVALSPWFFTHFGPEVSYSKNWVFPSDLLWYDRWHEVLAMGPRFVEIVSWNDYGESHYTGPLNSPHTDDGASKWVNDMPHDAWLEMAKPFIAAFKAGASSPDNYITSDQLIYWYRPSLRNQDCDMTDTCMSLANNISGSYFLGRPDGWQCMEDSLFVVSLLHSAASVKINSGGILHSYNAPAGSFAQAVPMNPGDQSFAVHRNGKLILVGTSPKKIIDGCVCGLYNFNAYVGSLPEAIVGTLQPDALISFSHGLHVQTCEATPSLKGLARDLSTGAAYAVRTETAINMSNLRQAASTINPALPTRGI